MPYLDLHAKYMQKREHELSQGISGGGLENFGIYEYTPRALN